MLIAAGAITATALFLAYTYLHSSKPPPQLHISGDDDDSRAQSQEAIKNDTETVKEKAGRSTEREADESPNTTPKQGPVPDSKLMPPPALPSISRAPPTTSSSPSSLMPPPSRPNPRIPKPRSTLAPPPSSASTLRAPPSHVANPTSAFAPSTSTLPPKSRPSRKVLLAPGHSPLDWAALTRSPPSATFLRGSDVPPHNLIHVTPSMLRAHNGRKGTNPWGVFGGKVYNMGPYVDFHPGGKGEILRAAGNQEGDKLFREVHPWVSWENMLGECCVGVLVGEEEADRGGGMDEMD